MTSRTLFRLNKADLYHSYHGMQDRDACLVLREYEPKMKWSSRHKVLDIGCGPGDLTVNYLLPLVPKNGEMVGIDISQSMIQLANFKYNDPRLRFEVMDVTEAEFVKKYEGFFNSVFSFYCLHWIQDHWNLMKNIFDVLQNGGETLFVFLANCPLYSLFEALSNTEKWSPYMHDYKNAISPYHYSEDPEAEVRNLLSKIGFHVKDCYCTLSTYTMQSKEILMKSVEAVNPFLSRIPSHLLDEFNRDCIKKILDSNLCVASDDSEELTYSYSLMTVYATKPDYINER